MSASAHLLRTLAAVPPGARIVDAACGHGRHLAPLARLGFDVWASTADDPAPARQSLADVLDEGQAARRVSRAAPDALGFPDAWADWGVLADLAPDALADALAEIARVLRPGAWVWVEAPEGAELLDLAARAGLALAEAPARDGDRVHAIFRRPGSVG